MKRDRGFTLVEIAIVVLIGSMLLIAGLSLFKARLDAAQAEVTVQHQVAIKQALIGYLARNKRLPCPDIDNNGAEDRNATSPFACTANFGSVPYVDLGLERSAALDGWENYIRYVVSPNWRFTYSSTTNDKWNATLVPTTTYSADAAFVPKVSTGAVAVYLNTLAGATPVLDPCNGALPSASGPVVALVSHGKNGFYATNVSGNANAGPTGPNDETQNASPNLVPTGIGVPPCAWNVLKVIKRDPSDTFDDVVMTISEAEFTGPLIASGAIQGGPDAALSKANDIVFGSIAGARAACPGPAPSSACTGFYYAIPASNTVPFPSDVAAYGVVYTRGTTALTTTPPSTAIAAVDQASPTPGTDAAYTLTATGGSTRTVTVDELRGILSTKVAPFN